MTPPRWSGSSATARRVLGPAARTTRSSGERRLLELYADVRALSRPRTATMTTRTSCCAARRSTCTRSCARSTPRPRACPTATSSSSSRALAHYGIERPRPHAALEEALLPAVPLPAARPHRARGRARDPRPPARARRRAGGRQSATSARCSTGSSRATDGRDPALAELAREVRCALLRRARDRGRARGDLRGDGGAPGRRSAEPDARRPRARWPRWSSARSRWRRARRPDATRRRPRRALVEAMTRRYYRMRTLEAVRAATRRRRTGPARALRARGAMRHLASAFVEPGRAPRPSPQPAPRWARRCPRGELAVADLYLRRHAAAGADRSRASGWCALAGIACRRRAPRRRRRRRTRHRPGAVGHDALTFRGRRRR